MQLSGCKTASLERQCFFVYDRNGKGSSAFLKRFLGCALRKKEAPLLSQVTIGGVSKSSGAESKKRRPIGPEHGKVTRQRRRAIRYGKKYSAASMEKFRNGNSPRNRPRIRKRQANLGRRPARIFSCAFPTLEKLAADSKQELFQIRPLLDAAGLDAMHSLSGHISLRRPRKTRVQAANPGRCRLPEPPFDIWSAPGSRRRLPLSFVPADAVSLHLPRNLISRAIYDTVKRVARGRFSPGLQQGKHRFIRHCSRSRALGMPVPDRACLAHRGIRFDANEPVAGPPRSKSTFLAIRKKPEALKLIRSAFQRIGSLRSAMKAKSHS